MSKESDVESGNSKFEARKSETSTKFESQNGSARHYALNVGDWGLAGRLARSSVGNGRQRDGHRKVREGVCVCRPWRLGDLTVGRARVV